MAETIEVVDTNNIIDVKLEDQMHQHFLEYAVYTLMDRAIPRIEDGLKPVQRRILYSMLENGLTSHASAKKCARTVGDVLGKFHPHGDTSVYEALVNMSQPWKKRYPLIAFTGNNGSIDGDPAAAYRYTESKLSKFGDALLSNIEMETTNMVDNFDETCKEPEILPGLVPNCLLNGSEGIGTGMATSMVPHYAGDVFSALDFMFNQMLEHKDVTDDDVIKIIKAPDFPTGGIIVNPQEVVETYKTGRGRVLVRAHHEIEEDKNESKIVFTEVPYMVNKKSLVESISKLLYNNKQLEGVTDIVDESDKAGIRIVLVLKKNANIDRILNTLFKKTQLQTSVSINNVGIYNQRPNENVSLLNLLKIFLKHACEVCYKKTVFMFKKDSKRLEIVNGFIKCDSIVDDVIKTIRGSKDSSEALSNLVKEYEFTEEQGKAIIQRQLGSLNKLNCTALEEESVSLTGKIAEYKKILSDKLELLRFTKNELKAVADSDLFKGDSRKTEISYVTDTAIDDRDLIKEENIIVIYTHNGMIKSVRSEEYNVQNKNGKGVSVKAREDDFVEKILSLTTKDNLVFITNKGNGSVVPAYRIPIVSKASLGKYINNYIELEEGEFVVSVIATKYDDKDHNLLFVTKRGLAKQLALDNLPQRNGCRVISFKDGDSLISCLMVKPGDRIIAVTKNGLALKTSTDNISVIASRSSMGNILMRFKDDTDCIVSVIGVSEDSTTGFLITDKGFGKRFDIADIPERKNKGGKGLILYKPTDKTGYVKSALVVNDKETIFVVTEHGMIIRMPVISIRQIGRTGRGSSVVKLQNKDSIASVSAAPNEETDQEDEAENAVLE